MRKHNEANERVKRKYIAYLKEAKGRDSATIDRALEALLRFEKSTNFKPFKNARTGKPLSHSTVDATLRAVKAFFVWLAGQPSFKSVLSYADCEYLNNTAKNARIAHAERDIPFPTVEQARRAFDAMPIATELQRRDKAIFALFMLTGGLSRCATGQNEERQDVLHMVFPG